MTDDRRRSQQKRGGRGEIIAVFACVVVGIALAAAADLAGMPALRWAGAALVIAGGVAIAVTSRW
jgi:hypothetical protein